MKRIVVLGGAGLIGSHLCIKLAGEGHDVVCIDVRDIEESPMLAPYWRRHDIRYINHNIVKPFTIDCDAIFNLASPSFLKHDCAHPVGILRTNIIGSMNALDMARRNKAVTVFASSGDVYGLSGQQPFGESDAQPNRITTYAESKRAAEAMHYAYRREYGINCRVARIFSTYGSGCQIEDRRVAMRMIVAALRNRDIVICGSGEQQRTFCWAGDIADGLVKLMELPASEPTSVVNLGSSYEVSVRRLAEKIVSITGSRSRIVHIEARRDDPRRMVPDLSRARTLLRWTPETSLGEGLARTVEYVKGVLEHRYAAEPSWVESY